MDPDAADQPCVIQALAANRDTLPPPLVQALPARHSPSPAKTNPNPPSSPAAKRRPAPAPPGPAPPSPRRTRSGGAPEWTAAETLALVAEVATVDDGWSRSVSAFQKWAMVAENLAASEAFASGPGSRRGRGGKRTAGECRRRWEVLAAEYGAVRRWEVRTGGTYWEMGAAARRKAGLPAEFDAEVYGAMDALIRVEEALLADAAGGGAGGEEVEGLVGAGAGVGVEVGVQLQDGGDSGEAEVGKEQVLEDASAGEEEERQEEEVEEDASSGEEEERQEEEVEEDASAGEEDASAGEEEEQGVDEDGEEMQEDGDNADASNDLGHETGTGVEPEKSQNIAWELANKLHENAQHIHAILNGEAAQDGDQNHALGGLMPPDAMEATRQKADELIQSLGGLVSYLNQFTELVKETGFENIAGMT